MSNVERFILFHWKHWRVQKITREGTQINAIAMFWTNSYSNLT
jgi:hypothetical protein